jgi:hypothetical protein
MDTAEALAVVEGVLLALEQEPYADLVRRVESEPLLVMERPGASGADYQIEVLFLWDDAPRGHVRVMASIDDGGWRAFVPLTRSFVKGPPS